MALDNEPPFDTEISDEVVGVDESWALTLLNESEAKEFALRIERGHEPASTDLKPETGSLTDSLIEPPGKNDELDTIIHVETTESPRTAHSLSAIEHQMLQRSQKYDKTPRSTSKTFQHSAISKLKSFFIA